MCMSTMSTLPAPKRRRFNPPPSALSKPFKSPVRTNPLPNPITLPSNTFTNTSPTPPVNPKPTLTSTPKHILPLSRTPASPHLSVLQKRHTALLTALAAARASLETHTQALKLETSSTDQELEALTVTWRTAGRTAAEEVFGLVEKRVEGMGGVRAWKEKERQKREGACGGGWGWDLQGESKGGNGEGEGEEEEGEKGDRGEREVEEVEKESDGEKNFTIDMMLRSLNIDIDVIGYDKETQKWVD